MASPFCRHESRLNYAPIIKKTLTNDYGVVDSYELVKAIDCMLEEYSIYERRKPKRKCFARRIGNLLFYPLVFLSMPFKWFFTGSAKYDVNTKIGGFLKWLLEG
jgi:hypothetical protein